MPITPDQAFKPSAETLLSLFGTPGDHFYLPAYQRPYSWHKDAVTKLLTDILSGLENLFEDQDTYSFCGSIITVTDHEYSTIVPQVKGDLPAKVQLVIDGQQRLTTLLLLCLTISNKLSVELNTFRSRASKTVADRWLDRLSDDLTRELDKMMVTVQPDNGDFKPIYPRMTRAFKDQWSRTLANENYASAIAEICHAYASTVDKSEPYEYNPIKAVDDARAVDDALKSLMKIVEDFSTEELTGDEDFSLSFSLIVAKTDIFKGVRVNVSDQDLIDLKNVPLEDAEFSKLLRLVILGKYLLNRVVLAKIICENDDYAFDVFEALNTSGTELDATETFPPLIIRDVTLIKYGASPQKVHLDRISSLLEKRTTGKTRQEFAKSLVITFALSESGEKISKRRSEQQKLLAKYAKLNAGKTNSLVENFRLVADLSDIQKQPEPEFNLGKINASELSDLKLALKFFNDLKHDIVIAPLSRFYAQTQKTNSTSSVEQDFVTATKAAMAFSVLWRCKSGGADGIDGKYRSLMSGDEIFAGLARSKNNPVDINLFKNRLIQLLENRYPDKSAFIDFAKRTNFYKAKSIGKILLLASHHDAAIDPSGKLITGVAGINEFLTFKKYIENLTEEIEHVAPQNPKNTGGLWDNNIYINDVNTKHFLGNLTLVSKEINLELGNHNWAHKKVLFESLSAATKADAQIVFDEAKINGIDFSDNDEVKKFVENYIYVPQFVPLSRFTTWDEQTIISRTENLLGLAYDRFFSWLN